MLSPAFGSVCAAEAFSDNLGGVGDHHEGLGVVEADEAAKVDRLSAGHDGQDDRLGFVCESTLPFDAGRASVEFLDDEVADQIGILGDDGKIFAHIKALHHRIEQRRLDNQAEHREHPRSHSVGDAGEKGDDEVGKHQGFSDVQAGVFFHNHCDDVGAAVRGVDVEEDGASDCGQADREEQFHQRLVGKGRGHRVKALQKFKHSRHEKGRICGFESEATSKHHKPDYKKDDVENRNKTGRAQRREIFGQDDGNTGDAAGRKVVRELKKVNSEGDQQRSCVEQEKFFQIFLCQILLHCVSDKRIM